jgi:hypothetical protein
LSVTTKVVLDLKLFAVIASAARQSTDPQAAAWIAASLRSSQ